MSIDSKVYTEGELRIIKVVQGALLTNMYVVYCLKTKDAFVIDPIKPTDTIKNIIAANELRPRAIILTHGHIDHIEGTWDFDMPVMIHSKDVDYLTDSNLNLSNMADVKIDEGDLDIKVLNDDEVISLNEINFKVINTPGHTPGSISLYTQGILFSGDTLFFDSIGRCDLPGGNCNRIISSIKEKLFVLPDKTKVFPGHGPITTIGREKQHNPFL
jgi:glyoxylase-like metal-dependent hydrolase (beta-lactamase superfamily II)